jgi:ABC-2 type transport system permease protein
MGMMNKRFNIINFILIGIIIILINVISSQYFFRLDLTEEKRFSISDNSKDILGNLNDIVYVEIYLDGELPAGFKRLQRSIRETLDEFRIYSGNNIHYKFVDPSADKDERTRQRYFMQLAERGVQPTNLFANEDGKQSEKLIFPGAIITYRGKETPVGFLKGNTGSGPQESLNQSVEGVEFELISAIKKLSFRNKKRIGILQGHGELSNPELDDIYRTLKDNYLVERPNSSELANLSDFFDLIIIAKPTKAYSEDDKLKIDQFIVKGGRALFLVDKMNISLDSLTEGKGLAIPYDLNIDDMLFKFGVRLNNSLYQDLQSGAIPMVTGMMGNQPQTQLVPWLYYPVISKYSKHPIVRNLSLSLTKFIGSIDTVKALGIQKTPLLFTSKYAKEVVSPINIDLTEAKKQPDPTQYVSGEQPVGYLLEGSFKSKYTNRLSEEKQKAFDFKSQQSSGKIIIFSDGDIIRNDVSPDKSQIYPLGFDKFMRKKFANKELIENSINFLCDDQGIINIRSKEIKLRLLDKQKIKKERTTWQAINVLIPVLLVFAFGLGKYYSRKKKYEV